MYPHHVVSWGSLELLGVPQSSSVPWSSLEFPRVPWISLVFLGVPWNPLKFLGVSKSSLDFLRVLRSSLEFPGVQEVLSNFSEGP